MASCGRYIHVAKFALILRIVCRIVVIPSPLGQARLILAPTRIRRCTQTARCRDILGCAEKVTVRWPRCTVPGDSHDAAIAERANCKCFCNRAVTVSAIVRSSPTKRHLGSAQCGRSLAKTSMQFYPSDHTNYTPMARPHCHPRGTVDAHPPPRPAPRVNLTRRLPHEASSQPFCGLPFGCVSISGKTFQNNWNPHTRAKRQRRAHANGN